MKPVALAAARALLAAVGSALVLSTLALPRVARADPPSAVSPRVAALGALEDAKREARAKRLGETAEWRRLLHAHPTAANGWESEPDNASFFLSARGRFDPEAELVATLEGLYEQASLADKHALCMFPARARFLADYLDPRGLPSPVCAARDAFFARMRPSKVLFVFSAYHVESPASAFGHVLLRVERDDRGILRPDAPSHALADLGIDYSADVGRENAVTYALKGLFGQFSGTFKALPYAAKVREYQDFESRDLWEYELRLTADEKRTFQEHLWELGGASFDYFYLSENCAYHVLALLDVVRPSARLLERLGSPVVPADALHAVWEAPGLVAQVRYRPSLRTVALARLRALTPSARDLARALSEGRPDAEAALARLREGERGEVLDAALDLLDLEHKELLLDDRASPARDRKYRLSVLRAGVPGESPELALAPPAGAAPHLGHGTRRLGLGSGYASSGGAFFEGRARLTLHDTLDPPAGLPELASVEALSVAVRGYPRARSRSVEVEQLTVVRVEKLAPWTLAERGVSYRFFLGGERVRDDGCVATGSCLVARFEGGAGVAAEPAAHTVLYARGDLAFDVADGLVGLDRRAFRVGIGPTAGVRVGLGANAVLLGEARLSWLPGAPVPATASAVSEARFSLGPAAAMGLFVRRQVHAADVGLFGFFYF